MGRAMLIICAGVLVSLGIVSISTSNQGKMITQNTVSYAEYTMAKNAAHTGIQMATQLINKDEDWPMTHKSEETAWVTTVQGLEVRLHTNFIGGNFWEDLSETWEDKKEDKIWFYSRAQLGEEFGNRIVEVRSHYKKRPFYELVPDFAGALQLPTDVGDFDVDGNAHEINGIPPPSHGCPDTKPPIAVNSEETKTKLESEDLQKESGDFGDGDIIVDSELDYEPTDELIERLKNSGNAITVNSEFSGTLGSSDDPGIFFIDGSVKLTGQQSEGFGIMIIQNESYMEYEDEDGNTLDIRGNFEFNGLVIFENAFAFNGRGTPTINGSVLIGETADNTGTPIDIDLGGNIAINYTCMGERYAKQAADQAVQQNKYTLLTSTENLKYN